MPPSPKGGVVHDSIWVFNMYNLYILKILDLSLFCNGILQQVVSV